MKSNKRKKRRKKRRRARDRKRRRNGSRRDDELVVWRGEIGAPGGKPTRCRVRIDLESLELAKGHDGFLRGLPEPVIMLGAYLVDVGGMRVAGRALWRMERPTGFPCTVVPRGGGADKHLRLTPPAALVLLAVAVEEDGGRDIQGLYGALERVSAITLWPRHTDVPAPLHIDELAAEMKAWHEWRSVHAMIDGDHVGDGLRDDDWIGAAAMVTPCVPRFRGAQRMHFASDDGLNDWTAELAIRM